MSVWFCIPSKRPPEEANLVLRKWRERGYKIALWVDTAPDGGAKVSDSLFTETYPCYEAEVNLIVKFVLYYDSQADWLVTGGDDIEPDANHSAEEIAAQCCEYFARRHVVTGYPADHDPRPIAKPAAAHTFGVMQPTGDKWGDRQGPYIERVCGSPWMGREFCRRMYQGKGPLFEGYFHMGEDEELQHVATKLGVLWQRPDLIHLHNHWGRKRMLAEDQPKFLERANSPTEWARYKKLFAERLAAGFPGHEPLEA